MTEFTQLLASHPTTLASRGASALAAARDLKLDPKLVTAAHQFEASLMQELLKPLSSGQIFGEEDNDSAEAGGGLSDLTSSSEGSGNALMSFGSEALAKALSEKGGMGIARRILDHFEAASPAADPPSRPAGRTKTQQVLKRLKT